MTHAQLIFAVRVVFSFFAMLAAFILFDTGTFGPDSEPGWMSVVMVGGIIGALFPWP